MVLHQKLELKQGQSLVMTPQLQQAIKLLQMSSIELQTYIETELERNPLLDRAEQDEPGVDLNGQDESAKPDRADNETRDVSRELSDSAPAAEKMAGLDTDFDNVYTDEAQADRSSRMAEGTSDSGWQSLRSSGGGSFDRDGSSLESTLETSATLADHLTSQLHMALSDASERMIGAHLIGMIDEAGYLAGDVAQVAEQLGTDEALVEKVLGLVQTFDPPGIGARNLKECLAIQLKERDRYDPAMAALIDNLELLAKRDFNALKRLCGVDIEDLRDMVDEIRQLDPKPGNAFGDVVVQPVIPDVSVRLAPDNTWLVELNSETLPRVLVNNQYYAKVTRGATRDSDKDYLSDCYANANWLIKSLEQRARTILAVAKEIVRQQDAFLVHGIQALRPLNLRNVADAIGMHESTVSRVTSNKYITTPRGIFEMKYFFTTAIASSEGGDAHSAEAVRHQIKAMIDGEDAKSVLSDDMIVEALKEAGIEIARRTVAKYREALGIPSSVQRRREKRAGL